MRLWIGLWIGLDRKNGDPSRQLRASRSPHSKLAIAPGKLGAEGEEGREADEGITRFRRFKRSEESGADEDVSEEYGDGRTSGGTAPEFPCAAKAQADKKDIGEKQQGSDALVDRIFFPLIGEGEDVAGDGQQFDARRKPDANSASRRN